MSSRIPFVIALLINGAIGARWAHDSIVTSVKALNLANKDVMQHIIGDVIKRQISFEVRFTF
jgi:meiotically up-regulated gene 157 (Mug157) protein